MPPIPLNISINNYQLNNMPYYFTKHGDMNDVGTGIIGILSIITGLMIYYDFLFLLIFLSCFFTSVGIWSIYVNYKKGNKYDWRGIIDTISGLTLFSIYLGTVFVFFKIIGIIIIAKGILTLLFISSKNFEQY